MSNKGRETRSARAVSTTRHRTDIDGLRAVAVLGVLAYHFKLGVPGGYGGVDVFFVISGFLIAGIIKSEIEGGTFSLAQFYVRRIRRILPALTACIIATSIAAAFLLFPRDFLSYGRSVLAAATSTSNLYFMKHADYFDVAALDKPLLHTWSLGVEEQFYLIFPLLLIGLFRFARKSVLPVLAAVTIVSIAYSAYGVGHWPEKAFYSTFGRAWELGFGVLIAFGALPAVSRRWIVEAEASAGLLLIVACYFLYSDATAFPGLAAIPLCLGAALVIHAGAIESATIVARTLSVRPAVAIGLISYSVYLWHWPLLALYTYRYSEALSSDAPHAGMLHLALAFASIAIGAASWRFIEEPFRRARSLSYRTVFGAGAAATVSLAILSAVIIGRPNWLQNWPTAINEIQFRDTLPGNVLGLKRPPGWPRGTYLAGEPGTSLDTVLWGDSFAQALIPGFINYQKRTGRGVVIAAFPGCPPIPGVAYLGTCANFDAIWQRVLEPGTRRVILAGRWSSYIKGAQSDRAKLLEDVAHRLAGMNKEVIILGPLPSQTFEVAPAMARNIAWGTALPPARQLADFLKSERDMFQIFARLGAIPNVHVIYPHTYLCDTQICPYSVGGKPMYSDTAHLSAAGVANLSRMFDEMFEGPAKS